MFKKEENNGFWYIAKTRKKVVDGNSTAQLLLRLHSTKADLVWGNLKPELNAENLPICGFSEIYGNWCRQHCQVIPDIPCCLRSDVFSWAKKKEEVMLIIICLNHMWASLKWIWDETGFCSSPVLRLAGPLMFKLPINVKGSKNKGFSF